MEGGIPAVLIYEDLETLTPYMHTSDDVVGVSLNSPALMEASARLAAAALVTLAGPLEEEPQFLRGDGDGNEVVELTDVIFTLKHLFTGGSTPPCLDAADADDDGRIDIADPLRILFHLFEGAGLPGPAGSCGPDLTTDQLGCEVSCSP